MHITDYLGIPKGHSYIDFVDVTTDSDTQLFIDPCLIERGKDQLSRRAAALISSYADQLYKDMRSGQWKSTAVFDEAHEIHDTKLGYGNGRNGKGKTSHGMQESLDGLYRLANDIPSISKIQDISLLVEDFAEDCMSDLLTNILRQMLSQYTMEQMQKYRKEPCGTHEIQSWDNETHSWKVSQEPYWLVDGHKVLLVPKRWVRKNFLFKAHQYLYGVIIERVRQEADMEKIPKVEIWRNMQRNSEHWEYEEVIDYTRENPDALMEYHARMPQYYNRANGCMDDYDLDEAVYDQNISETA